MIVPALDMLRLFFYRILNNKPFFEPDNYHIHHLLIKKYKFFYSSIILFILTSLPIFISVNYDFYLLGISVGILLYVITIYTVAKK